MSDISNVNGTVLREIFYRFGSSIISAKIAKDQRHVSPSITMTVEYFLFQSVISKMKACGIVSGAGAVRHPVGVAGDAAAAAHAGGGAHALGRAPLHRARLRPRRAPDRCRESIARLILHYYTQFWDIVFGCLKLFAHKAIKCNGWFLIR